MSYFEVVDDGELDKMFQDIEDNIMSFVYDVADAIYDESQRLVSQRSHDTGTLMKSGNNDKRNTWAMIGYNTPYAKADHDGFKGHIQIVPSHERRNKNGTTSQVKGHVRWMPERDGKKWLDDAVTNVLNSMDKDSREMIKVTRVESGING